jgi:phage shock protein E
MRTFVWLTCCAVVPFSTAGGEPPAHWIGVHELEDVIAQHQPVLVDLRTPAEYARGRIPGAVNVPVEILATDPSALDDYRDAPVLLYCRTVNKTNGALRLLAGRGFHSIYALQGGYEAYSRPGAGGTRGGSDPGMAQAADQSP